MWCVEALPLLVLFVVVGALAIIWDAYQKKQIVRRWADLSGLEIVSMRYCPFRQRPFFFVPSFHAVLRIAVRDEQDMVRKGWLRTGRGFSDRPDVKWDSDIGLVRVSMFLTIMSLVSGFVLLGGVRFFQHEQRRDWTTTEARVISTSVDESPGKGRPRFMAKATFQYEVRGVEYVSNQKLGVYHRKRDAAEKLDEYCEGGIFKVFYATTQPGRITLKPREQEYGGFFSLAGWGIIGIGLLLAVLRTKERCWDACADGHNGIGNVGIQVAPRKAKR